MWLMKTLLTSGCTNQRGAGQSADIRLGKVSDDLMELLRYDTMFTCHRQDVFNSLANKVLLKDY